MGDLSVARDAIAFGIKRLVAEQIRLATVLKSLEGEAMTSAPQTKTAKLKKRLRLKGDVAADLSSKIVKAVIGHRDGASRKSILAYLSRNGFEVGHHFNEPHLTKLVNTLLSGDTPVIRREGAKASTRYFAS